MFPSVKGRDVLGALFVLGWVEDRQRGSHRNLRHPERCAKREPNSTYPFAYDIRETIGPPALVKLCSQLRIDKAEFAAILRRAAR